MKGLAVALAATCIAFSSVASEIESQSIYIDKAAFKQSGLKKRLPHLFVLNPEGSPIYYQIGGSSDALNELIESGEHSEDASYTQSSWQKLKRLPGMAGLLEQAGKEQKIVLLSASPDWFDCTACTMQKESMQDYVLDSHSKLLNIYIK
ncbi:hypothetical protein [Pseudoalteromonas xiamenensis]